jgi:glucose-6-phosphate 1-dehydrogenase
VRKHASTPALAPGGKVAPNETHVTTFIVLGASGHLAKTKTFPALFQIYVNSLLPSKFSIYGYARTDMSREAFHKELTPFLKVGTFV